MVRFHERSQKRVDQPNAQAAKCYSNVPLLLILLKETVWGPSKIFTTLYRLARTICLLVIHEKVLKGEVGGPVVLDACRHTSSIDRPHRSSIPKPNENAPWSSLTVCEPRHAAVRSNQRRCATRGRGQH